MSLCFHHLQDSFYVKGSWSSNGQSSSSVQRFSDSEGVAFKTKNGLPRDEWFNRFIHRISVKHTCSINLTLHASPKILSWLRTTAGNEENATHYYQLLQQIVEDYNIDMLKNVGNFDEAFVQYDMKNRNVIAERIMLRPTTSFQVFSESNWNTLHFCHF